MNAKPVVRIVRRGRRWGPAERRTVGIGVVAGLTTTAVFAVELGRVWRRGSASLPQEADDLDDLIDAAQDAVVETARVAVEGYQDVSPRENALFNLLASFVGTFGAVRAITYLLRDRQRFGPFRDIRVGTRHIHHFVPGIAMGFVSGAVAVTTRDEALPPKLAVPMGIGIGLTLDESALLLELEDVYWTPGGLVSVQITLATAALLGALVLGLRLLRRGEVIVLEPEERATVEAPPAEAADPSTGAPPRG